MRSLAPGMVAVLAMLVGAPPAGAEVLETLTVDPARRTPLTSFTTLEKGQRYQLTLSGTITATGPEGAGSVDDALYCFDNIPASPRPYCQPPFLADNVRVRMSTDTAWLTIPRFTATTPPYASSHTYAIAFVAPSTGKLQAASYEAARNCTTCQTTYTGSFALELATVGTAPTPRPDPKPKPGPTPKPAPAPCTDARARAAAINEVRVISVTGGVDVRSGSGGQWCPTEVNAVLKQGDELSTDPEGEIVLAFADNSTVTVRHGTQLKISSFFTEGGVVRTELLLRNGEIAASVRRSETTMSDFRVRDTTGHMGSVRGTVFSVFADAGSRASVFSVTEGTVDVSASPGATPTPISAGQEVAVSGTRMSPIAPVGQAAARGGVNRARAADLALGAIGASSCRVTLPRTKPIGVRPTAGAWLVFVRLNGQVRGPSRWRVTAAGARAANPQARRVVRNCA